MTTMPEYRIDVDVDGLVRVDGLCIGRGRIVDGRVYLEVRDRMRDRVMDRGRADVPVDLTELMETLGRELKERASRKRFARPHRNGRAEWGLGNDNDSPHKAL